MPPYQYLYHDPSTVLDTDSLAYVPISEPAVQAAIAADEVLPAAPPPLRYVESIRVAETLRTTDDAEHDVFVLPAEVKSIYRAELEMSALDAANGACKFMAGILVWKRLTGANVIAPPSNITMLSQINDSAATSWIMNGLPSGGAFRIFVRGAAGRTIDWSLTGSIGRYAPEGLAP